MELLNQHKWVVGITLVAFVLMIAGLLGIHPGKETAKIATSVVPKLQGPTHLYVDISGAVVKPGVYALPTEARVGEALKAAGGLTAKADPGFVAHSLNLAQKLSDGMKLYIPAKGEGGGVVSGGSAPAATTGSGMININSATQSQLESLPGIGPVTAQAIISKRPYGDIADLQTKKVVSKAVYDKIKSKISTF